MSRHPALARLRVGCVQYLNSKPLIYGCEAPVVFDHPSRLAAGLAEGELDVALVPVFESFRHPEWVAVDGVAIAARGAVFSVFLAHRGPLEKVRTVSIDPASRTSVHLLKVLLMEYLGIALQYVPVEPGEADAALLIGNQAIDFRLNAGPGWEFFDLGEEWLRCTGLPFVFALWLMRPGIADTRAVAEELREIQREGLAHLEEIVGAETRYPPELTTRYLTQHIRFGLGLEEKAGLEKFRALSIRHGLAPPAATALKFI